MSSGSTSLAQSSFSDRLERLQLFLVPPQGSCSAPDVSR